MTDPTAATPLDLAAIRALADKCWKGPGVYPFGGEKIIALCDEIARLRAENATLTKAAGASYQLWERHDALVASMRPVVEAARAWDKWVREVVQAPPGALDGYEVSLSVAVAAYEQEKHKVVQPSPVSASTGKEPSSDGEQSPAAGDQGCSVCAADKSGIAETFRANDATIARLRTALNAAADALHDIGWNVEPPGCDRDVIAREAHAARDAARAAAQEDE